MNRLVVAGAMTVLLAACIAAADRKGSDLPDFTMTPAQEKVFLETFGAGTAPRAMYFRMKNERQARQRAEAERDRVALELQTVTLPTLR